VPVINLEFPAKLVEPLLAVAPYKVFYGGRGGGKSWAIARTLLARGMERPLLALCARETHKSLSSSVHALLAEQITAMDLHAFYKIERDRIYSRNGSEIRFAGIQNDPHGLKSFEGCEICWCEEADSITDASWEILLPTVFRRPTSELWISFNPTVITDTYRRWVQNPPPRSLVTKINYDENPFCPPMLIEQAEHMKATDPDAYLNVWQGHPRVLLEDAVYKEELRALLQEDRFTRVPYTPRAPVSTFWDIGWRNHTCIVLAQMIGQEMRVIDYVEDSYKPTEFYLKILKAKDYLYDRHYLPHDAAHKDKTSGFSVHDLVRKNFADSHVVVLPRTSSLDADIMAVRSAFPLVWIDAKKCARLLECLQNYVYEVQGRKTVPKHDNAGFCDGADAFRCMAMAMRPPKSKSGSNYRDIRIPSNSGWMA
jgi:phage terminase large subunit